MADSPEVIEAREKTNDREYFSKIVLDNPTLIEWANDEKNNSIDTEIGTSSTSPVLDIPVSILFEQFLG